MEILQMLLYILGSCLLVVLIILGIKLINTMNKLDKVIEDINKKVKTLDGLFSVIDFTTDKLAMLSDKMAEGVSNLIHKLFKRKKEKERDIYE